MSLNCPERNGTLTEDIDPTNFQHNNDYVHNLCAREKHSMKQNTTDFQNFTPLPRAPENNV